VAANALQLSIPFEADRILRFLHGLARKNPALAAITARDAMVNGSPGFVMRESDGSIDTMAIEHSDGKIVAIYLTPFNSAPRIAPDTVGTELSELETGYCCV
jgi:hypothetical protein